MGAGKYENVCFGGGKPMKILYWSALVFIALSMAAKQGCLSDRAGVSDNKRVGVRPVTCYCPCDRYHHAPRRNTCVKCGHAHAEAGFETGRSIPAKEPWELLGME